MKELTKEEKRATNFEGEVVYKNKGREVGRVNIADQEAVKYTTKKGIDPSFGSGGGVYKSGIGPGKPNICSKCNEWSHVLRTHPNERELYCDNCY